MTPKTFALAVFNYSLVAISLGCVNRESDESALSANERVVFVAGKSNTSGRFGDIVVLDIASGNRFYVTSDRFYDSDPFWSLDGRRLGFLSNRTGSSTNLAIVGIGGPHSLCSFDLDSKAFSIHSPTKGEAKKSSLGSIWWRPAWLSDQAGVLVGNDRSLIQVMLKDEAEQLVQRFIGVDNIRKLQMSPNGFLIAVEFKSDSTSSRAERLGVYNLRDSTLKTIDRQFEFVFGSHWLPNGTSLLFFGPGDTTHRHEYQVYDYQSESIVPFQKPKSMPRKVADFVIMPSGKIVGHAQIPESHFAHDENIRTKIFVLDPLIDSIRWFGEEEDIDDLTPYLPATR